MSKKEKAYFHLPGLFEFYELYKVFLPLFYHHREYFYDWCEIGSIYGSPEDCLWGGGRLGEGNQNPYEVLSLIHYFKKNIFKIKDVMIFVLYLKKVRFKVGLSFILICC